MLKTTQATTYFFPSPWGGLLQATSEKPERSSVVYSAARIQVKSNESRTFFSLGVTEAAHSKRHESTPGPARLAPNWVHVLPVLFWGFSRLPSPLPHVPPPPCKRFLTVAQPCQSLKSPPLTKHGGSPPLRWDLSARRTAMYHASQLLMYTAMLDATRRCQKVRLT